MRLMMRNACFIDALIQMFTSFYLSIIVPKRESADTVRVAGINASLSLCIFAHWCAKMHAHSEMVNVVPCPSWLSTLMVPPCFRMI